MYFSVRAVTVFGSIDARFDQSRFDLIDCFLIEVSSASYLFGGARRYQLGFIFNGNHEFELCCRPRLAAQRELVEGVLNQVQLGVRRTECLQAR